MSEKFFPMPSSLEPLEQKIAPAGTVILSTAGGVLTITGDASDNGIGITHVPSTGMWTITDPLAGTSYILNNGAPQAGGFNIPAQSAIVANLGDNNDRLDISPSGTPSGLVLKALTINMGNGNDVIVMGTVSAQNLQVTGATTINLGEGNDTLNTTQSATYGGLVKILGGGGNDTVNISGASGEQVFLKGLNVDLGTGNDNFNANVARFSVAGGSLVVKNTGTAGGASSFNINSGLAIITVPTVFSTSLADLSVNLGNNMADVLHFGSTVSVIGGNGTDAVNVNSQMTATSTVTFDLKNGANTTTLVTDGSLTGTSLVVKGGTGDDDLALQDSHDLLVTGQLNFSAGNGTSTFIADVNSTLLAGSLVLNGGTGIDIFSFGGTSLNVMGSSTFNMGAGANNNVQLAGTASSFIGGSLLVNGSDGTDQIVLDSPQFTILGSINTKFGNGTNVLLAEGGSVYIGGGVNFSGGSGSDVLQAQSTSLIINKSTVFNTGAGGNTLYYRPDSGTVGPVTYNGGSGTDTFALGNVDGTSTTRLSVNGAVTTNFGAGTFTSYYTDTIVHGIVNHKAGALAGENENIIISESTFNSAVNILLGAGNADVDINDVFVRGAFTLDTGAGNDQVNVDTLGGSSAFSSWFGMVKILTGAGDDIVVIGSSPVVVANAGNNFFSGLLVDGGAGGGDSFTQGNNVFVGTNNQVNFP
ncbi:MAG TPA: hypothetical protein DIT13_03015 [Verrucomicrobiales bacterium]|nr:hypothetical protein [Verrucomicrobiales bacterium]HRJ07569.1 hypothetical protein [Prosthecobacter sp.]HRK16047.1 hypothetical protein [Prosthecobacter sp.]